MTQPVLSVILKNSTPHLAAICAPIVAIRNAHELMRYNRYWLLVAPDSTPVQTNADFHRSCHF
jgi:hypothetical protein